MSTVFSAIRSNNCTSGISFTPCAARSGARQRSSEELGCPKSVPRSVESLVPVSSEQLPRFAAGSEVDASLCSFCQASGICCYSSTAVKEKCGISTPVLSQYDPEVATAMLEAVGSWPTGAWCRRCGCHEAPTRQDSVQSCAVGYEELEIALQERGDCPLARPPPYAGGHVQLAHTHSTTHAETSCHDKCLRCCIPCLSKPVHL